MEEVEQDPKVALVAVEGQLTQALAQRQVLDARIAGLRREQHMLAQVVGPTSSP